MPVSISVQIITNEHRASGIVLRPASVAEQVIIRDTTIAGEGDVAIDIAYPPVASWVWQTATLQNITIRGKWNTLVRLRHCWNARLTDVMAAGPITQATIASPETAIGFDLGGSMDVHVIDCTVTCAKVGVQSMDGEGLRVKGGYYMHVNQGVHLIGDPTRRGRWGTPVAEVSGTHIAYIEHGILAIDYGGLHLVNNDLYETPAAVYGWGCYLIRCEDSNVSGNRYWYNQPVRKGGAIVLEDCTTTLVAGNTVSNSMALGLIQQGTTSGTVLGINQWGSCRSVPAV